MASSAWSADESTALRDGEQGGRTLLGALLLSVGYFLGVHAGFALTLPHAPVALLWPPNALLLAALLLSPRRAWPLLIAATLPAHVFAEMSADVPLSMTLCWFVSNVAEALLGASVVRGYLHRAPQFDRFKDLTVFLLGAVLLGTVVSSFLDAGFVAAVGWRYSDFWSVWRTRVLSNALAALTLAPLIVHLVQTGGRFARQHGIREVIEATVLMVGLWVTCALVFLKTATGPTELILLYTPLPFLIWAALRLTVGGVSLCVASVAAFAIAGVLQERGPFTHGDPMADAMAVQVFLIIAATSLLLQCVSLSELRNARRIAVQRGERLQLALGAARMGIWDWEVGSHRLSWSKPPDEIGSMTRMLECIHPDDRANVTAAFAAVAEGADELAVEFRWSNMDPPGWAAAIGKVRQSSAARHLVGVHIDVSERRQQEQQMQAQREQLSHLSRVAVLGELSGALAHELSQPMTAILANAQAARRQLQEGQFEEVREIVEDIVTENKRAAEVIRRLRALFSRGTSDGAPVDVNECVRDVLALSHSDRIARDIAAEVRLAEGLPTVWADRIQLQQVLLNLMLNACDAMADNGPDERYLRISTRLTEEGDVSIDVYDRGVGIGNVEKIFEPFFTTKHHGLGLGLAICHTIVSAHRGRLWASNNPDRGATMHIVLPAPRLG